MTPFRRTLLLWLLGIYAVEALSFLSFQAPLLRTILAVLICLLVAFVTYKRPTLGLAVLATELVIGSKGGLFKLGLSADPDAGFNVRLALFAAFFLAYFAVAIKNKWWKTWKNYLTKEHAGWIALIAIVVFATINGIAHNNPFWFADANAWCFLALLLPVLDLATHKQEELKRDLPVAIIAGLVWISLETLFLFYFFSHNFPPNLIAKVYLWIRRTGVGEVTRILPGQSAFRVFFQSHIYQVFVVLALSAAWIQGRLKQDITRWLWVVSAAVVLISFSRSFWIGLAAGILGLLAMLIATWKQQNWNLRWLASITGYHLVAIIGAIFLCIGLLAYPYPQGGTTAFTDLLRARADTGEDAAQSRWTLLPVLWEKVKQAPLLGHGFGSTVTYESKDPRVVASTGGQYTTYAVEWGWVDFWVKWGILGIPVMLFLLIHLSLRLWRSALPVEQKTSAILILIALAVIHVFTPYLNHPLGLAVLLACEALLKVPKHSLSNNPLRS